MTRRVPAVLVGVAMLVATPARAAVEPRRAPGDDDRDEASARPSESDAPDDYDDWETPPQPQPERTELQPEQTTPRTVGPKDYDDWDTASTRQGAPAKPTSRGDDPTEAVELDEASLAHLRRAELLRAERRFEDAEGELLALQQRAPGWAPALFNLALCAEAYGDLPLAIQRYDAFVAASSGSERAEGRMRAAYLRAKLDADRPAMRKTGFAMFGLTGVGTGLALGGVGLAVTAQADLRDASEPGVDPRAREAPLYRVEVGTAMMWTGVGVASLSLVVGVALVLASDARARRLKLEDISSLRHIRSGRLVF